MFNFRQLTLLGLIFLTQPFSLAVGNETSSLRKAQTNFDKARDQHNININDYNSIINASRELEKALNSLEIAANQYILAKKDFNKANAAYTSPEAMPDMSLACKKLYRAKLELLADKAYIVALAAKIDKINKLVILNNALKACPNGYLSTDAAKKADNDFVEAHRKHLEAMQRYRVAKDRADQDGCYFIRT